jgi:hypothetical protein
MVSEKAMIGVITLIALGSAVAGVLVAYLLFNISRRIQRNRQDDSQNKVSLNTGGTTKQRSETMANIGTNKPNRQAEDRLESLLKNHDHMVASENQSKSLMLDILERPVIIDQKNTFLAGEQEQSSEQGANSVYGINSEMNIAVVVEPIQSSKRNAAQEQTKVNYRNPSISENRTKSHRANSLKASESVDPKIRSKMAKQNGSPQSDIIKELETNLAIATTPWSDKLMPFQTALWDAKRGEDEPLLTSHIQELTQLYQLYVDVGLANNIVWLANEIGHRSKELDESYIKLCVCIAERVKKILSSLNKQ